MAISVRLLFSIRAGVQNKFSDVRLLGFLAEAFRERLTGGAPKHIQMSP